MRLVFILSGAGVGWATAVLILGGGSPMMAVTHLLDGRRDVWNVCVSVCVKTETAHSSEFSVPLKEGTV